MHRALKLDNASGSKLIDFLSSTEEVTGDSVCGRDQDLPNAPEGKADLYRSIVWSVHVPMKPREVGLKEKLLGQAVTTPTAVQIRLPALRKICTEGSNFLSPAPLAYGYRNQCPDLWAALFGYGGGVSGYLPLASLPKLTIISSSRIRSGVGILRCRFQRAMPHLRMLTPPFG